MSFYCRDDSLPYWQANVDVESLFQNFAHNPEKAKAWLRYRKVAETCIGFERAVMMNGHFEGGVLSNHTFCWTFTPGRKGDLAIVVPAGNDFVAMSRHDHNVWGACTGHGQYVGSLAAPRLRVHRTLAGWLASDCDGVLPLAKSFLPQLRNAPKLVAEDDEHAWDLAYRIFIDPAARFGCE